MDATTAGRKLPRTFVPWRTEGSTWATAKIEIMPPRVKTGQSQLTVGKKRNHSVRETPMERGSTGDPKEQIVTMDQFRNVAPDALQMGCPYYPGSRHRCRARSHRLPRWSEARADK